jgi:hypothetical protein
LFIPNLISIKTLHRGGCKNLITVPDMDDLSGCKNLITLHVNDDLSNNDAYKYFSKRQCAKLVNTILEELIQRTWHPNRVMEWCWDEDEKKFMGNYIT